LEIRWTSPETGLAEVTGGVWALRDWGRSNYWQITLNGDIQASGYVYSGDPYGRSSPALIDLDLNVDVGDVLAFTAWRDNTYGNGTPDYLALDLSINVVPVPGAVLLGMIGLGATGLKLRRYA
jgi:hypothetical protein